MSSLQQLHRLPSGFIGEKIELMLEAEGFPKFKAPTRYAFSHIMPGVKSVFGELFKEVFKG